MLQSNLNPAILWPMFVLVAWTFLVLLLVPIVRFKATLNKEVNVGDFRYGESERVPGHVSLPNRNYMNLLEMPPLFYVLCLLLYVTGGGEGWKLNLAWAYVILRILHSAIHLSYNNVLHRLGMFTGSVTVLLLLWVMAGLHLAGK